MKQQIFLMLISVLFSLSSGAARTFVYEFQGQLLSYNIIDETTKTCCTIESPAYLKNNLSGTVQIPEVAYSDSEPYMVVGIAGMTFNQCTEVLSIKIPNTVSSIGYYAFANCENLVSIEMPTKLATIEEGTFSKCYNLETIIIPESVTKIGACAFKECRSLSSLIIPDNVVELGNEAFNRCVNLSSLIIGQKVNKIGEAAFYGCDNLTSVTLPNSLSNIEQSTFAHCPNLSYVFFPESVISIGEAAFWGCYGLSSINIPNSVQILDTHAFAYCTNLESVSLGTSLKTIGDGTFAECRTLQSIDIPNSVSTIGEFAFNQCLSLAHVTIGNSVVSIEEGAFNACIGLQSVKIGNSVRALLDKTFGWCHKLKNVSLGNNIEVIGNQAFFECDLEDIVIPPSVKKIGASCFAGNTHLSNIAIGPNVIDLGQLAFENTPANYIYATAQIPPNMYEDTFSDFSGMLLLQGQASTKAYAADEVWGKFNSELMVDADDLTIEGENYISGQPGETFQLKANISPANVTLPYIFWSSTNPRIATVDNNGLVTLMQDTESEDEQTLSGEADDANNSCKIIAESLYFDGPIAEVTVYNSDFNGVGTVMEDFNTEYIDYWKPYQVYNMSGVKVGDSREKLTKGIYVIRQGNAAVKISVK